MRAVRRAAPDRVAQARAVLDSITLIDVSVQTFEQAGRLGPSPMQTLDAVYLAAALELGNKLDGIVTYDDRVAEAARLNGVSALAPRWLMRSRVCRRRGKYAVWAAGRIKFDVYDGVLIARSGANYSRG